MSRKRATPSRGKTEFIEELIRIKNFVTKTIPRSKIYKNTTSKLSIDNENIHCQSTL